MIPKNRVVSTPPSGGACTQIPQDGLVASYLLQGTAEDETGTYNGSESNITYSYDDEDGIVGAFNGSTSKIESNSVITGAQAYSFWIRPTTLTNWDVFIANSDTGMTGATGVAGFSIYGDESNVLKYIMKETAFADTMFSITTSIAVGTNYHVVCQWDGTTNIDKAEMFINGSLVSSGTSTKAQVTTPTGGKLSLGVNTGEAATLNYSNTKMRNVHIYNRALTAQEVTNIYNLEKYQHNNALDNGLIAYYPLDGNSLDNAINQYDGTDTNITYPTDTDMGVVAEFNGTSSYIDIPHSGLPSGASPRTIVAWVNFDSFTGQDAILEYGASSNTNRFGLRATATTIGVDISGFFYYYQTSIPIGTWKQVVVTYSGGALSSGALFYVDATLLTVVDSSNEGTPNTVLSDANIGSYINKAIYSNCQIAKARVYDRALSAKEIDWLYDYEKPNSTECLYNSTIDNPDPFEDGSGIALYKLDGNANDTTGNYDGTPTSITYADGEFGQSAVFTASTSYINTGFKPNITSFSISLNVKPDSVSNTYGYCSTQNNTGTDRQGIILYQAGSVIYATCSSASGGSGISSAIAPSTTQYTHIVYIYDNGTSYLYVNGVYKGTTSAVLTAHFGNLHIGSYYASVPTSVSLGGYEDQFRYFNKALTADEVTKLYNERKV